MNRHGAQAKRVLRTAATFIERPSLRKNKRNGLADRPIAGLDEFGATGLVNKGLIHSAAQQRQVGRQSFWSLRKQDRIKLFSWIDHEGTAGETHPPIISQ